MINNNKIPQIPGHVHILWDTVECRYDAIQYSMLLYTLLHWLRQNMNESVKQNKKHPISRSDGRVMGWVAFVWIFNITDRVLTEPHCSWYVVICLE